MKNIDDYLKSWMRGLREQAVKEQPRSMAIEPIDVQLARYLDSLPNALLNREWHLNDLLMHLRSPWGDSGRPHPRTVGAALRRMGWIQKRRWLNSVESIRVWIPPTLYKTSTDEA